MPRTTELNISGWIKVGIKVVTTALRCDGSTDLKPGERLKHHEGYSTDGALAQRGWASPCL